MNEGRQSPKLIFEEKKAIKLFLWLFYIFFITYSLFWCFIIPKYTTYGDPDYAREGLGVWLYIAILALLPLSIYFCKRGNLYIVKYIILYSFIFTDIIDNLLRYFGTNKPFASGNIVELILVFFAPIFVNKNYFWTVSLAIIGKYIFLGIVLQDADVLSPIVITMILTVISFILLTRFSSYILSLNIAHEELRQKEKLALIGQMAAAIGHEIRNPLASLKGFAQLQHERYPEQSDYYPIIIQEIDRIDIIVNDLMFIGKPKGIHIEQTNMKDIIEYTISIMRQQANAQNIHIESSYTEDLPLIECDEKHLKQVFINLLKNAIEAMPDGGTIKINVQYIEESEIIVSIEDEGCGIKSEDIPNLTVPFYTTKKSGTGLGLVVTNQIIKEHNGDINMESESGKGTKVTVTLPVWQKL
ncbi:ATP-binding protein [Neobacillus mesonae]|uniref:histidine kinase n=1 Tax=Neobacillus mesonae TaxID=1193713 RepID=A0A3T0HUS1_9BACI|nr:ATP-binding protein [Neobacillus mesonae]AZU60836.1 two-component sensor histidine kinase [Neobacillus mesonae]